MPTQNARLLRWLETHDDCTTAEVTDNLKIYRLSERIRELEALGFQISHTPETTENGARVIRYRLAMKAVPQVDRKDEFGSVESRSAPREHHPAGTAHDAPSPCYDRAGRLICYAVGGYRE